MDGSQPSILPTELDDLIGTAAAPIIVDLRSDADLAAIDRLIPGAIHRSGNDVERWWRELPSGRSLVVYDLQGSPESERAAEQLNRYGTYVGYLLGGFIAWYDRALPTRKNVVSASKWVTRERPKIDRIACPWLIHRFIDPLAEFLYVPAGQVRAVAEQTGAIPYDVNGVEYTHEGNQCSFDKIVKVHEINISALNRLATIVRGADTARHDLAPECDGLVAISRGLSENFPDDHEMLAHGMVLYDALFSWCRKQTASNV